MAIVDPSLQSFGKASLGPIDALTKALGGAVVLEHAATETQTKKPGAMARWKARKFIDDLPGKKRQ
jgi:hypothetical protein